MNIQEIGDLLVHVNVWTPKKVNSAQKIFLKRT